MVLIEVISVLVGIGGLAFGVYQYYQSKTTKQRKQRLKELSDNLDDTRSRLEKVKDGYKRPLSGVDLATQLDTLSKSALGFRYETGQSPLLKLAGISGDESIRNGKQALERFKEDGRWVDISIVIDTSGTDYEEQVRYDIYDHLIYTPKVYNNIETFRKDYADILEEFEPGLIDDLESTIDEIVQRSHGKAISKSDGIHLDLDQYNSVDEISKDIFRQFWEYDGVEEDISDLEDVLNRLEETRTAILQASYS